MKIKLLTGIAGKDFSFSPGEEVVFDGAEAQRMIDAGFAEPVRQVRTENTSRKIKREKAVK